MSNVRASIVAILHRHNAGTHPNEQTAQEILDLIRPSFLCGACGKVHLCRNCWPRMRPTDIDVELEP